MVELGAAWLTPDHLLIRGCLRMYHATATRSVAPNGDYQLRARMRSGLDAGWIDRTMVLRHSNVRIDGRYIDLGTPGHWVDFDLRCNFVTATCAGAGKAVGHVPGGGEAGGAMQ